MISSYTCLGAILNLQPYRLCSFLILLCYTHTTIMYRITAHCEWKTENGLLIAVLIFFLQLKLPTKRNVEITRQTR